MNNNEEQELPTAVSRDLLEDAISEVAELIAQEREANAAHDRRTSAAGERVRERIEEVNLDLPPGDRFRWALLRGECECLVLQVQLEDGTWVNDQEFPERATSELINDLLAGVGLMQDALRQLQAGLAS